LASDSRNADFDRVNQDLIDELAAAGGAPAISLQ